MVKHLPTMQEICVRSLGQEDPLEKEMATHSSTLAWKIPWTKEPGRLQSLESQRVGRPNNNCKCMPFCHSVISVAPHSSTLAWKIPWTKEPGRLQSMGLLGVRHDWATSLSLFTFMHWRRKWQPTSVLAWRIPGTGEPGGLPSVGSYRVRHNWSDLAIAISLAFIHKVYFIG